LVVAVQEIQIQEEQEQRVLIQFLQQRVHLLLQQVVAEELQQEEHQEQDVLEHLEVQVVAEVVV
jgi:hypothetical protein